MGFAPAGDPGPNEVFMRAITFDPPENTIRVGESITRLNRDIIPHNSFAGSMCRQGVDCFHKVAGQEIGFRKPVKGSRDGGMGVAQSLALA